MWRAAGVGDGLGVALAGPSLAAEQCSCPLHSVGAGEWVRLPCQRIRVRVPGKHGGGAVARKQVSYVKFKW